MIVLAAKNWTYKNPCSINQLLNCCYFVSVCLEVSRARIDSVESDSREFADEGKSFVLPYRHRYMSIVVVDYPLLVDPLCRCGVCHMV